jgi:hypothetical protein
MKRIFFFMALATVGLPVAAGLSTVAMAQGVATEAVQPLPEGEQLPDVAGQPKLSWRKTDDHWARKNSITVTGSTMGISEYAVRGMWHVNLEYDRALPYNLSVSAIGLYAPLLDLMIADSSVFFEELWFAGAKANYNLPVVRNWLYLRIGIGVGLGYHKVKNIFLYSDFENLTQPEPKDIIKPYAIIDMYWVLRATKWLEFRFAPGLVSPSQVIVGAKLGSQYFRMPYVYYNMLGTLGVTVRF